MVVLSESMIAELILGLTAVGASIIWSLPATQRGALEKHQIPKSFRIEQFVPQKALLGSGRIRCFITHGGSNSCQEAAAFGVPVLCVPFMWDQPYNCSLLVRLGMARMLPKHRVTRARVSREVRELLDNPRYAESAKRWASALEELYGSAPQQEFRRELVE
jgi:UDP:flavonoid glycosyltransferase YjiC (YdhE family)